MRPYGYRFGQAILIILAPRSDQDALLASGGMVGQNSCHVLPHIQLVRDVGKLHRDDSIAASPMRLVRPFSCG